MNREEFIEWLKAKGFHSGIDPSKLSISMRVWIDYVVEVHVWDHDFGIYLCNDHDPDSTPRIDFSDFNFPSSPESATEFFRILGVEF
jgi:hypothetical protein